MAERSPAFKDALSKSMGPVIELLNGRFCRIKLKGEQVRIHAAATEDQVNDFFNALHVINEELDAKKLPQKDLKKLEHLQDFMTKHCRARQYMFQVCNTFQLLPTV